MLKRNLAPITSNVWEELDSRAKEVLSTYLSGRKVVNVHGPKGWDYTVIPEGRLEKVDDCDKDICYGMYKAKPLMEVRSEFELNRWELDNLTRGAKDIDLKPLEEAVRKVALFEENAIYNGIHTASIKGLMEVSKENSIDFGEDGEAIIDAISEGMLKLKEAFVEKPYKLVVGKEAWKRLNKKIEGYPLIKRVEDLLGSEIVYSHVLDGALLIPYDHEDIEMTIGNDFSIGYQDSDTEKIKFFITESFTLRILDEDIIVQFTL